MSFLSDENLTFHRFSDGTISFTTERKKSEGAAGTVLGNGLIVKPGGQTLTIDRAMAHHRKNPAGFIPSGSTPVWTTHAAFNNYTTNNTITANGNRSGSDSITDNNASSTTTAGIPTANDLRYLSSPTNANNSSVMHNGSTVKLLSTKISSQNNVNVAESDDQSNKQQVLIK